MQNAYFALVSEQEDYGLRFYAPVDGGEPIVIQELVNYLDNNNLTYDLGKVKEAVASKTNMFLPLGKCPCPVIHETYQLTVSPDNMLAVAKFIPPSSSAPRMEMTEFMKDLSFRMIKYGIQEEILQRHFSGSGFWGMQIPVARGLKPRQGKDAEIKYYFNTDVHARPEMAEDGSVDYFKLNMVNHCKAGDLLAEIIPEDPGDDGENILGVCVKPRVVKKTRLEFGRNIELSPDRLSIRSMVSGHVMLVGRSVFVSDIYEVENVDTSTGNIDFDGSVQINGNVATNYVVKATGDIYVKGVVEGAVLEAGGNITIARGMNGMGKGTLKAGGNIIAKYIENSSLEAGGFINTESILHSNVVSGDEVLVTGRKGFITGGRVQAASSVEVRTLGALMGADTIVEVGTNPQLKAQYLRCQKDVAEIVKLIRNAQPVIANFMEKKAKGARFTPEQLAYVKNTAATLEQKKQELNEKNEEMKILSEQVNLDRASCVRVTGEVYPGTTIVIGEVSMYVHDSYKYCRFEKVNGEVRMMPL